MNSFPRLSATTWSYQNIFQHVWHSASVQLHQHVHITRNYCLRAMQVLGSMDLQLLKSC